MFKRFFAMLSCVSAVAMLLSACSSDTPPSDTDTTTTTTAPAVVDSTPSVPDAVAFETEDTTKADAANATDILLSDNGCTADGGGVAIDGTVVTVTAGGTYRVVGALSDGQLRVEAKGETVRLLFDGVSIHSETSAPLYIKKSEKTIITLADGSDNTLSDAASFVYEDAVEQEPSSTLFSKSDLVFNGNGRLTVKASFGDGIVSRDSLKIADGDIRVTSADDALMGRDFVLIGGGRLTLDAEGDGIKSTNDQSETVGLVDIRGGELIVTAGADGVQAKSALFVSGGTLSVTAGGGSQNGAANSQFDYGWGAQSVDSDSTGKGLKAGTTLSILGGDMVVDAADDGLHANGTFAMSGGKAVVSAGDDGVHADVELTVSNGSLTIAESYEGLEAATIVLSGGTMDITASDDGINASTGASDTSGDYGFGRNDPFASDESKLVISGGTLIVDAWGDGLDSNGTVQMSGGDVTVFGPQSGGNGTLDYAASFDITGGTLVAVGSLGMAQTPSGTTQSGIVWNGCSLQSGDELCVTDESGRVIASLSARRTAQWAYISHPDLTVGDTYIVTAGGEEETISLQAGLNTIGSASGGMGGFGGPGGPGGRPNGRPGRF